MGIFSGKSSEKAQKPNIEDFLDDALEHCGEFMKVVAFDSNNEEPLLQCSKCGKFLIGSNYDNYMNELESWESEE